MSLNICIFIWFCKGAEFPNSSPLLLLSQSIFLCTLHISLKYFYAHRHISLPLLFHVSFLCKHWRCIWCWKIRLQLIATSASHVLLRRKSSTRRSISSSRSSTIKTIKHYLNHLLLMLTGFKNGKEAIHREHSWVNKRTAQRVGRSLPSPPCFISCLLSTSRWIHDSQVQL